MKIQGFDLSKKVFIIAELSANHNGSIDTALNTWLAESMDAGKIELL